MPDENRPAAVPELTLGWRLNMALRHGNIEIQQMADYLEVGRATISRWIHDHGARPRTIYLKEWALKCGVDYGWLATGTYEEDNVPAASQPAQPGINNPLTSRVPVLLSGLAGNLGPCKLRSAA